MDSQRIVKVKSLNRPTKPEPVSQPQEQPQIELPEQPKPVVRMESLAEFPKDESVYGSGWSERRTDDRVQRQSKRLRMKASIFKSKEQTAVGSVAPFPLTQAAGAAALLSRAWYLLPPLFADESVASQSAVQCHFHVQISDLTRPRIATVAGEAVGDEQYEAVPLLVEYAKR